MQYEIYIDSLLVLNLSMNIYLLELTNCLCHHTAGYKRILLGASLGSVFSVIPYLLPCKIGVSVGMGFLLDIACMSFITFRVNKWSAYLKMLEILSLFTIVLGTFMHYMMGVLTDSMQMPLLVILLIAGLFFGGIRRLLNKRNRFSQCKVILKNGKSRMCINALVDTGNSLVEPISGEPVAVLDKGVFENLFMGENPTGFRVIPYRSIDQKTGLLPAYLIPEMIVELEGFCKEYHNIYVGIRRRDMWEEERYKMIINPKMLKERKIG